MYVCVCGLSPVRKMMVFYEHDAPRATQQSFFFFIRQFLSLFSFFFVFDFFLMLFVVVIVVLFYELLNNFVVFVDGFFVLFCFLFDIVLVWMMIIKKLTVELLRMRRATRTTSWDRKDPWLQTKRIPRWHRRKVVVWVMDFWHNRWWEIRKLFQYQRLVVPALNFVFVFFLFNGLFGYASRVCEIRPEITMEEKNRRESWYKYWRNL